MIHPMVPITPTQSTLVSREIAVMRRYSKKAVSAQTPIASSVAGIKTQVSCKVPINGRVDFRCVSTIYVPVAARKTPRIARVQSLPRQSTAAR